MEDKLQKLVSIVDQGGFSKAALKMHISQPALTTAIKKLEKELGVKLLDRKNGQISLTKAGSEAYKAAKKIDTDLNNLKQKVLEFKRARPEVAIGMTDSMANAVFEQNNHFMDLSNHVDLSLAVNSSNQLLQSIIRGELDAAVVVKPLGSLPELIDSEFLGNEPLVLVTHPDLKEFYLEKLENKSVLSGFLSYNPKSNSKKIIEKELKLRRISVKTFFYSTSPEVILKMTLAKQGIAVLPYILVKQYLVKERLYNLSSYAPTIIRPIYVIKRRGQILSPVCDQAFANISESLGQLLTEAKASLPKN